MPELAALPVQYADYTLWQHRVLGSESDAQSAIARQLSFWRERLAGLPEALELAGRRARPAVASYRGGSVGVRLSAELHAGLLELSRARGASLFMVLQAGLAALLTRLGAGSDIPIGSPIAGRTDSALDDLIGFFVNTLVLRTDTSGNPSFGELVARVRSGNLAAYSHQELPFERLVEVLNPERSLARHPLFQVMLAFQNNAAVGLELAGLTASFEPVATASAKFDLSVSLGEERAGDGSPAGISGVIEYASDLFDRADVEALAARLIRLLEAAVAEPGRAIGSLDILAPAERETLLRGWNDTVHAIPAATLPELFAAQALRTPAATAVVFEDATLSYRELDERANRLAHHLRGRGVGPEVVVGLCLERSPEMVIGLLAILKAGGAYLPLDPAYPRERLAFMLEDAGAPVLVTHSALAHRLGAHRADSVRVDADAATIAAQPASAPAVTSTRTIPLMSSTPQAPPEPRRASSSPMAAFRNLACGADRWLAISRDDAVLQFDSLELRCCGLGDLLTAADAGAGCGRCPASGAQRLDGLLQRMSTSSTHDACGVPPVLLADAMLADLPARLTLICRRRGAAPRS